MERSSLINDAHVHIGRSSGIFRSFSADDIVRLREKHKIGNIMIMSFEQNVQENNEKIVELAKRHDFITGLFWIQKSRIQEDALILPKLLKNSHMTGVKFHGSYENTPVSSPVYKPIMQVLNDNESVLLVHTGRYKDAAPESNTSYVHALKVAKEYPKINVIFAHMGGSDTTIIKRALQDSKDVRNIYFDTSGITTPYIIEYAVKTIDARRILFGSDEPWCSFMSMYYNIADAEIDERDRHLILSDNFVELLMK